MPYLVLQPWIAPNQGPAKAVDALAGLPATILMRKNDVRIMDGLEAELREKYPLPNGKAPMRPFESSYYFAPRSDIRVVILFDHGNFIDVIEQNFAFWGRAEDYLTIIVSHGYLGRDYVRESAASASDPRAWTKTVERLRPMAQEPGIGITDVADLLYKRLGRGLGEKDVGDLLDMPSGKIRDYIDVTPTRRGLVQLFSIIKQNSESEDVDRPDFEQYISTSLHKSQKATFKLAHAGRLLLDDTIDIREEGTNRSLYEVHAADEGLLFASGLEVRLGDYRLLLERYAKLNKTFTAGIQDVAGGQDQTEYQYYFKRTYKILAREPGSGGTGQPAYVGESAINPNLGSDLTLYCGHIHVAVERTSFGYMGFSSDDEPAPGMSPARSNKLDPPIRHRRPFLSVLIIAFEDKGAEYCDNIVLLRTLAASLQVVLGLSFPMIRHRIVVTPLESPDNPAPVAAGDRASEHLFPTAVLEGATVASILSRLHRASKAAETLVLPRTAAKLNLYFAGADGRAIAPRPDGTVTIGEGADVRLFVDVLDDTGHGLERVPASRLGNAAVFSVRDQLGRIETVFATTIDAGSDRAVADFSTAKPADGRITATMRVNGLETNSEPLTYRILPADTKLAMDILPDETCPTCTPDDIGKTLHAGESGGTIARVKLSFSTSVAGKIVLRLTSEDGVLGFGGAALSDPNPSFEVQPGLNQTKTYDVLLKRPANDLILKPKRRYKFTLEAQADPSLTGAARRDGAVVLAASQPSLAPAGNSQDPLGKKDLAIDLDALDGFMTFELKNVIGDGQGGSVKVDSDHGFLAYDTTISGDRITVKPSIKPFCACFLYFTQGERQIRVVWNDASGLQTASSSVHMRTAIPFLWQAAFACGKLVGLALLVIYLVRGLIVATRTRVFPQGSGFDVVYKREDPRFVPFPSGLSTKCLAFVFPFGNTHQRTTLEGLRLQATKGGALVVFKDSEPSFRFENRGETIAEMLEAAPRQKAYLMSWNETAESKNAGRRLLRLLKASADRPSRRESR